MKIYFAGSISGGRDDAALYNELITQLAQYGQVLTEHVGAAELSELGDSIEMTSGAIYSRDMAWLQSADVVVAEVTTPSLGVGYELAWAQQNNKKIVCLFRPNSGRRLSPMIEGGGFTVKTYETAEEAGHILKDYFA